jgi:archaeal cell division control protein 6
VNLKIQGGSRVLLYRHILNSVAPTVYSPGYGAEELLRMLLEQLSKEKKYLLISLDEIDYIKSTKDTGVVYDLTRLNEINPKRPCNVLGVIFTARIKEFHDKLEPAEVSSLGRITMKFSPYNSREVFEIMSERVKEA